MAGALQASDDRDLIKRLVNGDSGAWEVFLNRYADQVYSLCCLVFSIAEIQEEYQNVLNRLRADNFASLRPFDGRSKLSTYLTLKLSDMFGLRIIELFDEDTNRAWAAFKRFFDKDIQNAISKCFRVTASNGLLKDGTTYEELYQDICRLLIEDHYQGIKSYHGRGAFGAFIRKVLANLCKDVFREKMGRRRLRKIISRLPPLEQKVFKLLYWQNRNREEIFQLVKDEKGLLYSREIVEHVMINVDEIVESKGRAFAHEPVEEETIRTTTRGPDGSEQEREIPDPRGSPEDILGQAEEEQAYVENLSMLTDAIAKLPEDQQLYLQLRYYDEPPMPPREIARNMRRTIKEIYKIHQEIVNSLRGAFKSQGHKNMEVSV